MSFDRQGFFPKKNRILSKKSQVFAFHNWECVDEYLQTYKIIADGGIPTHYEGCWTAVPTHKGIIQTSNAPADLKSASHGQFQETPTTELNCFVSSLSMKNSWESSKMMSLNIVKLIIRIGVVFGLFWISCFFSKLQGFSIRGSLWRWNAVF